MNPEPSSESTSHSRAVYEVQLTDAECIAALRFNQARLLRRLPRSWLGTVLKIFSVTAWAGLGIFASSVLSFVGDERTPIAMLWRLSVVAAPLALFLMQYELRGRLFRSIAAGDIALRRRRTISLEEGGLRAASVDGETWLPWSAVKSIEECGEQILVYFDGVSFIPIPGSAFTNPSARAEFLAGIRCRVSAGGPPTAMIPTEPSAQSVIETSRPRPRRVRRLDAHLIDGFGLALFRRPTLELDASEQAWATLIALVFLTIGVSIIGNRLVVGPRAIFSSFGIPGVLFTVPVALITAWTLGRLEGRAHQTLGLMTVIMSVAVPVGIVEVLFRLWDSKADHGFFRSGAIILASWFTLASVVAAIRLLGTARRRWGTSLALTGLLMGFPLAMFYPERTLWWKASEKEEELFSRYALAKEDAFYHQPKILDEQLVRLKPSRPGVVDLYFVGLAAYAMEDVFMKEVQSMTKLFDERFDTAERSLMLINNTKTVHQSPIASATGLSIALKRLSEIMDRNEDILFLFMTSHGSKEKGVAFEFFPLEFEQLGPQRLKSLLDEYGFKRRVVVVSACYSGQYVEGLKDENTVVISASAADKNSFGCSNDADFTYFGKAYFEALQQTYSFIDAFELAKPMIARREDEAHFRHSEPAIFVGESIKGVLEDFAHARESSAKAKSAQLTE